MISKIFLLLIFGFCLYYLINRNKTLSFSIKEKQNFSNETFQNNSQIQNQITYGLKIIDKLFNKHNIYYTAAYGTLLGAIRHWDMIPWDDDGDLNVWRKDYNKIINLKDEFKKYGLILETDFKLIKIYFNDAKYPFIDLFINDIENDKIVRCTEPYDKICTQLDKKNDWWWKWINYPAEWIIKRKRLVFGSIKIWGPIESEKILKYWYGNNCLTECKSQEYDHVTGTNIQQHNINCNSLPKPQL